MPTRQQNASGPGASTHSRAHGRAFAAARDGPDDRADGRARTYLFGILLVVGGGVLLEVVRLDRDGLAVGEIR